MMGVNFAFGDYENFHAAISAGIIPSDCFIVLRSNGDAEFLFLDRDNNLVSIVDRNRFESIDEAMSYASDSRLSGKTISVFDGVQWRLYIIQADGSMDPVVLSGDEEPSISLDKTLTISGMAADAKAVGDTIEIINNMLQGTATALAGRLDTLEAIDRDAYVAADTALKTELQAAIDVAKTELKEYVAIHPDWSQSDESAADFIKNKTHYSAPIHAPLIWNGDTTDLTMCGASMSYLVTDEYIDPENYVGATIVFSDGREHIITEENMNISTTGSSAAKGFFTVVIPEMNTFGDVIVSSRERVMDPAGIYLYNDGNFYIARINFPEQLKQLDEKYIPDAIARTADVYEAIETLKTDISAQDADVLFEAKDYTDKKIASIEIPDGVTQMQADWNQTDTTKADFILNKPVEATDDEVMALLIAYNVIMPVSDSTGYVYLDKDQKILVM